MNRRPSPSNVAPATRGHALALVGVVLLLTVAAASPVWAQTPEPVSEPALRRWFEIQTLTLYSRYRLIENRADVTTANQLQYKDAFKARFNIDPDKRYTVNLGYFSGGSFISTWNNWGVGTGDFNGKDNYLKQLYLSAAPLNGLEVQYGGIYVVRGESDDITSYDDDGYIVGERVSVRRPKELYLDEIAVTRGEMGPFNYPALGRRWDGLQHPDYTQVMGSKRFNQAIAGSLDYSTQSGADTVRGAITLRWKKIKPIDTLRYEQYRRLTDHAAAGFSVWADGTLARSVRLQGGYATIDQFYGGWNADRIQTGRRFFAVATVPLVGPVAAQLFATQALQSDYAITLKRRFDVVISYDALASLRRTGLF